MKCIAPGGAVTYSDRGCPSTTTAAPITAPPIAEPTARDAAAAQRRRVNDERRARLAELNRQAQEARAAQGPSGMNATASARTPSSAEQQLNAVRCAGVQYDLRRGAYIDPLSFDRTPQAQELRRAEREFCR